MTLQIEIAPDVQAKIEAEAQARGVAPAIVAGDVLGAWAHGQADSGKATNGTHNGNGTQSTLNTRLAAIAALPTCDTRRGLPELDLSGERADVYGYTEREDAQR
jgi:hypothetical protein